MQPACKPRDSRYVLRREARHVIFKMKAPRWGSRAPLEAGFPPGSSLVPPATREVSSLARIPVVAPLVRRMQGCPRVTGMRCGDGSARAPRLIANWALGSAVTALAITLAVL